jgi:hypothetical protein
MILNKYLKTIGFLILTIALVGSIVYVPLIDAFISGSTPAGADYVIFEGTAASDYYDSRQYSYLVNQWYDDYSYDPADMFFNASKSLRIGMTENGELATSAHAGIAYGANAAEWANTESWAAAAVASKDWIQGWVLYLNYTRQTKLRCLLAWGIYSDFTTNEGGRKVYTWKGQYEPDDPLAELTNGSMSSTGLKILYDSARLGVARATVTIHDAVYDEDVCALTFTLNYQKDTKYATLFKDYKTLLDPKVIDVISDFAFSERYEIDLARGVNPDNTAFIHYYHGFSNTVYQHPLTGEVGYDVLQAFDPARQYILFAGYWPTATEYSVYSPLVPDPADGETTVLPPGFALADIPPSSGGEPNTPWVIAQWRYNVTYYPNLLRHLSKEGTQREIRFVEVLGMTDYNDDPDPAYDMDAGDNYNQVDVEPWYLLDGKVFNPEDLRTVANNAFDGDGGQSFMWIGLGQSAATTDSAGSSLVTWIDKQFYRSAFPLFDRNDTMFPWTAPVVGMSGSIPYGVSSFGGNYYETFNNAAKGAGTDTTPYKRTGLNGFAFGIYDGDQLPPQPIAGGYSVNKSVYWYPSKCPLTERWDVTGWEPDQYDIVGWHPNGIMTLGGMKANGLTRYFNDFGYAISREGTAPYALVQGGSVTNSAPTSDPSKGTFDFFPLSSWNSMNDTFGYKGGYAVISLARDINGTRGLSIYGWDGRDTFYAAAWASQYLGTVGAANNWIPPGTVSLILHITYSGALEPTSFDIVKALGTITELGTNAFVTRYGYDMQTYWYAYDDYLDNLPEYPRIVEGPNVWWFEKLPTTSTAIVEYDT